MDVVGLKGDRVRLVPLDRSLHLENAYRWLNDPAVTATLKHHFGVSRSEEEAFFERSESARDRDLLWGIHDESGRHLGMIGLHVNWRMRCASGGLFLGARDAWGQGFGTDAVRVRTRFAFEQLGLHRVEGHTFNPSMRRIYEKAGYRAEGVSRKVFWRDGRWNDAHRYALIEEDYFGTAPAPATAPEGAEAPAPTPPGPIRLTVDQAVGAFHMLFYDSAARTWDNTHWLGARVLKCPTDAWIYQEILWDTRPDLIVECGTRFGGSAFYLATLCDLIGHGEILTIDVDTRYTTRRDHPRITYLAGSSVDGAILDEVRRRAEGRSVMAVLDSDHSRDHVLAELYAYAPIVTPGQYLVVEDTNINGHPVLPGFGPGPMEALREFLAGNDAFEIDRDREKFFMTFNPSGYLRKKHPPA
ncbi:CmcI family methyltransferase [Tautonia plasticadhaerens]|uniref:Rhamnosyl O-methyltransferase n=1 Tax=Tautonia plasticadhaerens TaxID=2527974 RepID=A0A518HB01_9BACT|nr:CmcI family methyltransferase [Tautonia plasticadhaerens]QDV38019.1 Rhamnosyl O-methyltransferase precursor [Tautonia plasticadhaerens]